ncbi:unnamed protein product, partial [Ectocarpus sp. 13 AM-2016]
TQFFKGFQPRHLFDAQAQQPLGLRTLRKRERGSVVMRVRNEDLGDPQQIVKSSQPLEPPQGQGCCFGVVTPPHTHERERAHSYHQRQHVPLTSLSFATLRRSPDGMRLRGETVPPPAWSGDCSSGEHYNISK